MYLELDWKLRPTTNKKWGQLPKGWSTRKQHTEIYCICEQEPGKCRKKRQQYRKRSTGYTIQTQKPISTALPERWVYYRWHTTSSNMKKDLITLSQRLAWTLLRINQYRVRIIYKPGPNLFIADCLSRQKLRGQHRCRNTWHAVKYWCHTN